MKHRSMLGLIVLFALAAVLSGCNMPTADTATATTAPTVPPTVTTEPTPAPIVTEEPGGLPAVGWYGLVTGLQEGAQFDDYLFLLSEGAGSLGIAGADDAVAAEIDALREGNTRAFYWGAVFCNVPDYNGCQLMADRVLAEGDGVSPATAISGWQGRLYSVPQGGTYDDYFVLEGDFPIRYGITVPPENDQEGGFSLTLAGYRDSDALLSVTGSVVCGVADVNGCQIRLAELEELEPGTTTGSGGTVVSTPRTEVVTNWTGAIVRNGAGAAYTYAFQFWEATRRVGVTSVDGSIQQQIVALAGAPGKVHIWGTLFDNNPATPDDDVITISALEVEAPTAVPRQPTSTPIVLRCALSPRLQAGNAGRVAPGPLPNAVRSAPGTGNSSVVLGNLPGGTVFTVLEGPVCMDGYNWWRVNANGFVGWTAEGQNGEYWLDPMSCGSGLSIRLVPGAQGRVTLTPPLANSVRSQPGRGMGSLIGEIPPGGVFSVLSGPQCGAEGMAWWRVNYNGLVGWTAEGEAGTYWLEPYTGGDVYQEMINVRGTIQAIGLPEVGSVADDFFEVYPVQGTPVRYGITATDPAIAQQIVGLRGTGTIVRVSGQLRINVPDYNNMQLTVTSLAIDSPTPQPTTCTLPTRLWAGYSARVTEGLPNAVRTAPGTSNSTVQANLPGGAPFRVIEGPRCVEGYNWWRITTGSITGWTAEGQSGGEYWLEPLMCGNELRSQLMPGMQARVTYDPPNANTVRATPGEAGAPIGEIPPGGVFTVLAGPQCAIGGMTWWQVNYNGLVGWTAEGIPGQYWLEPVN